ncbi:hypothetical protein M422DRAFT_44656 [Sphaerobolus stellatus SS14]|nr:hypothetical protein M422DRAFT_44656 [Sphaerobolus stellatus SS14]
MPRPAHLYIKSVRLSDTETIGNKFYPLCNAILNECFPPDRFSVCPHYATYNCMAEARPTDTVPIIYVIEDLNLGSVIFFHEIKPSARLPIQWTLQEADKEIREDIGRIAHWSRFRNYIVPSRLGETSRTTSIKNRLVPLSLLGLMIVSYVRDIERRDLNIMEEEGCDKFFAKLSYG